MRSFSTATALLVLLFGSLVAAWTAQDHEIFRLKDELEQFEGKGVTFYDFLGVKPSATQDEINVGYRKKSKRMHPDKAKQDFLAARRKVKAGSQKTIKAPTKAEIKEATKLAEGRFTRLGLVTKILRGEERERYDHFLKHGFPAWKGFGYAYNRYRPGLGTVLIALFIFGGGGAHYGTLYLSHKQHKKFVEKFIKDARRQAWGDSIGIRGIPAIDAAPQPAPGQDGFFEDAGMPMNRKQRRLQEKNVKKGRGGADSPVTPSGRSEANNAAAVERRKVTMENGKVLIVDSIGNVVLVEEDEDGNVEELPLDLNDIKPPTWHDTILFRVPKWAYTQTLGKALGSKELVAGQEDTADDALNSASDNKGNGTTNGGVKKRTKSARNR